MPGPDSETTVPYETPPESQRLSEMIERWLDDATARFADLQQCLAELRDHIPDWIQNSLPVHLDTRWCEPDARKRPRLRSYLQLFPDYKRRVREVYCEAAWRAERDSPQLREFEFRGVLGSGGDGEVCRCHHTRWRDVAIKFRHNPPGTGEAIGAHFEEEGFVRVYQRAITDKGRHVTVMQLMELPTLQAALDEQRRKDPHFRGFPVGRAARMIASLLERIAKMHGSGYLHNDLKPENLFLDVEKNDSIWISDFDRATEIGKPDPGGTRLYMAPERHDNSPPPVTCESDIYSAGCIMYDILTGKRCHPSADDARRGYYQPLQEQNPALVDSFLAAVRKALAFHPVERRPLEEIAWPFQEFITAARAPQVPSGLETERECFGRADEVLREARRVADLAAKTPRSALYHGLGGIGKSTFAQAVAHHPLVAEAFGSHRYYVRLDGVTSADRLIATIAGRMNLTGEQAQPHYVDATLADGAARLLLLDTVDDPLHHGGADVERVLRRWGNAIPRLTLLMTARLDRSPPDQAWFHKVRVPKLKPQGIRETFLLHSGGRHADHPKLADVLGLAAGMPLAAELHGWWAGHFDELSEYLAVYQASDLRRGDKHTDSITACVRFSLDRFVDPDRDKPTLRLLRLLADLPDGLFHDDIAAIFPKDHARALAGMRRVGGLAEEEGDHVTMLAPIRETLQVLVPRNDDDWHAAIRWAADWCSSNGSKL